MSGTDPEAFDEFAFIANELRPLADGATEALGLRDDAAVVPGRDGWDLVITTDTLVEGVHFLDGDPPGLIARKLMRVNLSDLAAKGAEPYGYFLTTCWPPHWRLEDRKAFAAGLAQDQAAFGLALFGGDTTSTPGPLTVGITMLGKSPERDFVPRDGAAAGHRLLVTGTIGDGWLGLQAARGELAALDEAHVAWLADRYRLPQPRIGLLRALRLHAAAAADVSDGLVADALHIAGASGVGLRVELDRLPLSDAALAWLDGQGDRHAALAALATGGDDYEIACAAAPEAAGALIDAAAEAGIRLTDIGVFAETEVEVISSGVPVTLDRTGWRHG
jgi:thiamine-monophosphate kinase